MTHAIAYSLLPELASAFKDPVEGTFALKVKIENEAFTLVDRLDGTSDADADFQRMKTSFLVSNEACYCLHKGSGDGTWSLLAFVPDEAPVRDKMTYSSGRAALVKSLGGGESIQNEKHCDSLDEVLPPSAAKQSESARAAEQHSLMTDVEKLRIEGERAMAAESAAGNITSVAGLTFPMSADAEVGLAAFRGGTLGALVLSIEGETMVKKADAPAPTTVAALKALVPAEPCYCLYRWPHEREAAPTTALVFLYICPEDAPVRAKMLHASTKGPFVTGLQASGLEIVKSVEGVEAAELSDAELTSQLYAEAVASGPTVVTKAAPRGGRKLVKKRADPVEAS